ncbi:MAG: formyltransferase family protein [Pseudolabrys sp.]
MIDSIILLTGPVEEAALSDVLRRYNPRLTICPANSREQLEAIDPKLVLRARLIGFVTPVVVPARILNALGFGAYNFHPGPPNYPGWVPAHFAIYDKAGTYGATVHRMTEQVDAGAIVDVELFEIPPGTGVMRLQEMAFTQLARLFWRLAPVLATQREPLAELPIKWSGTKSTSRMFAAMCDMPVDISKEELERRIEVFGAGDYGVDLTVTLHGRKFRYVPPEENKVDTASSAPAAMVA